MKNVGLFLFGMLMNLLAWGQEYNFSDLRGKWRSVDGAGLEIIDSNNIFLIFMEDKKPASSIKINLESVPGTLDFDVKDQNSNTSLKTILSFVHKNLIQWQVFEERRPSNFTSKNGEILYLRRVEE